MDFLTVLWIVLLVFAILVAYIIYKKTRRLSRTEDLPKHCTGLRLSGKVTHVPDGDGFRFFHCPWLRSTTYTPQDPTLSVRLAGIDAPEMGSSASPGQPFSKKSKNYLESLVKDKKIEIMVVGVDQYARVLAFAYLPGFPCTNVNLRMVKEGLACVYTGRNAKYDGYKVDLLELEEEARRGRKGMWLDPDFVTPMQYKRMHKHGKDIFIV